MNTIKTVFLAALLSAAAYGVYVGVTGAPPSFGPRRKAHNWEETGPPDPFNSSFSETPAVPVVSVDAVPPAPAVDAAPVAVAPASGGLPTGGMQAPLVASADGGAPADSGNPAAVAAGNPPDRYSSTQAYPSMRPDGEVSPAQGAEAMLSGDPRYPSTGLPAEAAANTETPPADDIHADFANLIQSVESLLAQNRLADAHLELSEWYGDPRFSPEQDAHVTDLLDRLAGTVIYSRDYPLERPYEAQPGDTLEKIADMYEVPAELLANINGLRDPRDLLPGSKLKVVKGPFNAYISLSKMHLVLYLGNRYAGRFQIGVGSDHPISDGEYVVLRKQVNPAYYGQTVIDKDDPKNPLGEFAVDLGNNGQPSNILIHGTNDPASIGRKGSRGCISMGDRDIRDVFNILSPRSDRTAGSKVKILR